jgi:streptogramin lyase
MKMSKVRRTAVSRGALLAILIATAPVQLRAQAITEFPSSALFVPAGIVTGPDGNLWLTDPLTNRIDQMTTGGTVTSSFPIPTSNSDPQPIVVGPDNNLWFVEFAANKIARATLTGVITEFPIPTATSLPQGIAAGPDANLWFTEPLHGKVGRITTSGAITEFTVPGQGTAPEGITAGPDGALWFADSAAAGIGRITMSGVITEFPLDNASPQAVTQGADGALWFTAAVPNVAGVDNPNAIGRITTSGSVTIYPVSLSPQQITAGPDGALWFTEIEPLGAFRPSPNGISMIGRLTTSGVLTEFPIPTAGANAQGIAAGPDGNLWFAEGSGRAVGKIVPTSAPPSTLLAAVLPESRSVQIGQAATVFATILNTSSSAATGCGIAPVTIWRVFPTLQREVPGFLYQTTNPTTNVLTGSPNIPVTIPAGGSQTFVVALTPTAAFPASDAAFAFTCDSELPAPVFVGVNTLTLASSATATPDIVALAATNDNGVSDGIVDILGTTGAGAFAVATINLGADATITVSADTGSTPGLPVVITLCQTNTQGQCLASPASTVSLDIPPNATPTFAVFVQGQGQPVLFVPQANRIFVRFAIPVPPTGFPTEVGGTSVAVRTQ